MQFDDAIKALSAHALKFVKDGNVIGLGSGRAATAFVRALGASKYQNVRAVPTSLQIRLIAERAHVRLVEPGEIATLDAAFDGADQIDSAGNMIKGGGGALLLEKILISSARKVVIMADTTKFVRRLNRPVPVEVHPAAREHAVSAIRKMGGSPAIRVDARKYPTFTQNGNIILDSDFGAIDSAVQLERKLGRIAGVIESGLFTKKPDVIYRAKTKGRFDVL